MCEPTTLSVAIIFTALPALNPIFAQPQKAPPDGTHLAQINTRNDVLIKPDEHPFQQILQDPPVYKKSPAIARLLINVCNSQNDADTDHAPGNRQSGLSRSLAIVGCEFASGLGLVVRLRSFYFLVRM